VIKALEVIQEASGAVSMIRKNPEESIGDSSASGASET
jgi:hypothetical protein